MRILGVKNCKKYAPTETNEQSFLRRSGPTRGCRANDDKTLHVSGILSAHHQEFSTVHSAPVSFMQVFDDHFQAEPILTLPGSGHQKPAWNLPVPNVQ